MARRNKRTLSPARRAVLHPSKSLPKQQEAHFRKCKQTPSCIHSCAAIPSPNPTHTKHSYNNPDQNPSRSPVTVQYNAMTSHAIRAPLLSATLRRFRPSPERKHLRTLAAHGCLCLPLPPPLSLTPTLQRQPPTKLAKTKETSKANAGLNHDPPPLLSFSPSSTSTIRPLLRPLLLRMMYTTHRS